MTNPEPYPSPSSLIEIPKAYAIVHDWGRFVVSSAAHDAYRLIPLSPTTEPDDSPPQKNSVTITLLSPEEHQELLPPTSEETPPEGGMQVTRSYYPAQQHNEFEQSFDMDRDQLELAHVEDIAKAHHMTPERFLEVVAREGPLRQDIAEDLESKLLEMIRLATLQSVYSSLVHNRQEQRRFKRLLPVSGLREFATATKIADSIHCDYCPNCFRP